MKEDSKRILGFALYMFLLNSIGYGLLFYMGNVLLKSSNSIQEVLFNALFFGVFMSLIFTPIMISNLKSLGLKTLSHEALSSRMSDKFDLKESDLSDLFEKLSSKDSGILKEFDFRFENNRIICSDKSWFGKYESVLIYMDSNAHKTSTATIKLEMEPSVLLNVYHANIKRFDKLKNVAMSSI